MITFVLDAASGLETDRHVIPGGPGLDAGAGVMAFDGAFNLHNGGTTGSAIMSLVKFTTLASTPYQLQLSQLGNAAGAVRSFDAYLRIGGPLSQEASYGRIRALRQLGRWSDARAASDAFIAAYPKSVQAAALRKERP